VGGAGGRVGTKGSEGWGIAAYLWLHAGHTLRPRAGLYLSGVVDYVVKNITLLRSVTGIHLPSQTSLSVAVQPHTKLGVHLKNGTYLSYL